jgi:hypothetical protein
MRIAFEVQASVSSYFEIISRPTGTGQNVAAGVLF